MLAISLINTVIRPDPEKEKERKKKEEKGIGTNHFLSGNYPLILWTISVNPKTQCYE